MEERCEFIWQIIEESPVLRKKLNELEEENSDNNENKVNTYIELFKEVEEIMEIAVETYHSTRILNNNSL
jgi:hypothetical protein